MTVLTDRSRNGGFLISELDDFRSRISAILNSGQNLFTGTVLGRLLTLPANGTAVAGNTGNGTVTVGAAVGKSTIIGQYLLVCVAASANAGTFNLYDPMGNHVRQITVGGGATVSPHLTITIADGGTDFVVGDSFTIDVTGGDFTQLSTAATTGAQIPAGILWHDTDASGGDTACVVIYKEAAVDTGDLVWPAGISQANKDAAIQSLFRAGIVLR